MLDSLVRARDQYLVPGGLMFPSRCTMMWGLVSDEQVRFFLRGVLWMSREVYKCSRIEVLAVAMLASFALRLALSGLWIVY